MVGGGGGSCSLSCGAAARGSNRLSCLCRWQNQVSALFPSSALMASPSAPLKSEPKAGAGLRQRELELVRQNGWGLCK